MGLFAQVNLNSNWTKPDEIAANQRGQFSEFQQAYFDPRKRRSLRWAEWALLGLLLSAAVLLAWWWSAYALGPWTTWLVVEALPVGFGSVIVRFLIQEQRFSRDMAKGRIVQSDGQVVWKRSRYVVQIPRRQLHQLGGEVNLLPGDYRFWYLPRSGMILSAERQNAFDQWQVKERLMQALASAIPFSNEALAYNQRGQLHGSQALRLSKNLAGLVALVPIIVALIGYVYYQKPSGLVLVFGGGWAIFIGWRLVPACLRLLKDIRARQACQIDGLAHKDRFNAGNQSASYVWIGDMAFRPGERGFNGVIAGIPYRAYYAPQTQILLSIEPLAEPVKGS